MKQVIKKIVAKHPRIKSLRIRVINFLGNNDKSSKYNIASTVILKNLKINDCGNGNKIIVGENSRLNNCTFRFYGNNNTVQIGENCILSSMNVWIEDDNNEISLGDATTIHGETNLACIEGTRIEIGKDCMLSSYIHFRTGDSHSVIDMQGERINRSKDIQIGNHVWIGQNVFVGKGSSVADNSVVGAYAVVTKQFDVTNAALAGNPAKIIKEKIDWRRERI